LAKQRHRIVVVGGGAGGLELATRLGNTLGARKRAEITLVERNTSHIWKPLLHEVAAGTLHTHHEQVGYLTHGRRHHFRYRPGEMRGLDRAAKIIKIGPLTNRDGEVVVEAQSLEYDTLVLAVGSQANDFGTPGAREHCRFIDSRSQAEAFTETLRGAILRALSSNPPRNLSMAIIGAGATGVELAAEISSMLDLAAGYGFPALRQRLRLTLLEGEDRILGALAPRISSSATVELQELGVEVMTGVRVVAVDSDGVALADGRRVAAELKVWAAGVKAPAFLQDIAGLETNRIHQLIVRPTLQPTRDDDIYVIGDCASLTLPGGDRPLPATAQVAHQQARYLARALARKLKGKTSTPFRYRYLGSIVSLSDYNAFGSLARLGVLPGGFIGGRVAQLSYASLYRRHQVALHGTWRAALLWLADALTRLSRPPLRVD
jgi:NADH dehydrogenase